MSLYQDLCVPKKSWATFRPSSAKLDAQAEQAKQRDADEYDRLCDMEYDYMRKEHAEQQHDADMPDVYEQQHNAMMNLNSAVVVENESLSMRLQMEVASDVHKKAAEVSDFQLMVEVQKKLIAELDDSQQQIKALTEKIKLQNARMSNLQNQINEVWHACRDVDKKLDSKKRSRFIMEEKLDSK